MKGCSFFVSEGLRERRKDKEEGERKRNREEGKKKKVRETSKSPFKE